VHNPGEMDGRTDGQTNGQADESSGQTITPDIGTAAMHYVYAMRVQPGATPNPGHQNLMSLAARIVLACHF